jgi:branched-chain amino acid transport system permease protein
VRLAVEGTRPIILGAAALAVAAVVAPALPSYPLTLLTQVAIMAILAMSLDILLGYTGLPSLGHAAYFGTAAYAVGILSTERQAGFVTCLVAGVLVATLTAALFGLIAIRATGTYFLMITLALGMVVWGLAFRWVSMTKGDNGISGVPRPEVGLPWSLWEPLPFFYFSLVAMLLAWALLALVVRSPFGLTLKGIRESEARMRALGYDVPLHLFVGFTVSGFFAGLAGALYAFFNSFVSPSTVALGQSVEGLLMAIVGGVGTLFGGLVGSAVIIALENVVSAYTERWMMALGLLFVFTMIFAPAGVLGRLRRK